MLLGSWRSSFILVTDAAGFFVSGFAALWVLGEFRFDGVIASTTNAYVFASTLSAVCLIWATRLDQPHWRYGGVSNCLVLVAVCCGSTVLATLATIAVMSFPSALVLPVLHASVAIVLLLGMRVACRWCSARQAVFKLRGGGAHEVQFFTERLDLTHPSSRSVSDWPIRNKGPATDLRFAFTPGVFELNARRSHWRLKRVLDVSGSLALLFLLSPLMAVTALLVALAIGHPILFRQARPGRAGVPFRLYKFRTMRDPFVPSRGALSDSQRLTAVGAWLRRTRLDELPQLWNILRGDMSFVGPRPLLVCDQCERDRARLLVRPGLTGWAQVTGGSILSADDKAALDVWYIKNASFALDLEIALRTIPFLWRGERVRADHVALAWRELRADAVVN